MTIKMKRKDLPPSGWSNPALFFDKGFQDWSDDKKERGGMIGKHLDSVCGIPVPQIYKNAYRRWLGITADKCRFESWFGTIDGRLFIGLGMPHVLETQVARNPTYGMPYIPGSALKGLARAMAEDYGMENEVIEILFGNSADDPEKADAGYLVFHDAWWVPHTSVDKPYVREIVTVHAGEYYKHKGSSHPHPDMESPNPNHQIAVQGSFYFVVEGKQSWAELGMKFLRQALEDEGVGGKIAAGYGYFKNENDLDTKGSSCAKKESTRIKKHREKLQEQMENMLKKAVESNMAGSLNEYDLAIYELEKLVSTFEGKAMVTEQEKGSINKEVNKIIKSDSWPKADRGKALPIIKRAYSISIIKKKRDKKIGRIQAWVNKG